jgi:hypothetical protein
MNDVVDEVERTWTKEEKHAKYNITALSLLDSRRDRTGEVIALHLKPATA